MSKGIFGVVFIALLGGCEPSYEYEYKIPRPEAPPTAQAEEDVQQLVAAQNAFAFAMYEQLRQTEANPQAASSQSTPPVNLLFSPTSIALTLNMAAAGADGPTRDEMLTTLQWPLSEKRLHPAAGALLVELYDTSDSRRDADGPPYQLHLANGLWTLPDYPIESTYTQTLRDHYASQLHTADFAAHPDKAAEQINQWVAQHTAGQIAELVSPGSIDPKRTRLMLVNALYFKGTWVDQFQEHATETEPFKLSGGGERRVPMMKRKDSMNYHAAKTWHAVELDYRWGDLSMVIFLPRGDRPLRVIESQLDDDSMWSWLEDPSDQMVDLWLPRFDFSSQVDLKPLLSAMGMSDAFDVNADFSRITTGERLFISRAVHEARLNVNEHGSEAAAATALMMESISEVAPDGPPVFHVDQPCVFAIRHKSTGLILFLGRLTDPRP